MHRRKSAEWRPKGKTNKEILAGLLSEGESICAHFTIISARHFDEINEHRALNEVRIIDTTSVESRMESTFRWIFEIIDTGEFDYDHHEARRKFLAKIESKEPYNAEDMFFEICTISGIKPLYESILSAHRTMNDLYDINTEITKRPKLDFLQFEFLQMDVSVIQLHLDVINSIGVEEFLARTGK